MATPNDQKSMTMVTRMMWLYAVAKAGRLQHATSTERGRPVGFLLEHPTVNKPEGLRLPVKGDTRCGRPQCGVSFRRRWS